ncbi:ROK family protein [Candidatus Sumerlaeota bacterium]|nr:ROK family protein [Candidatus Sumerlaeota bacterium]
MGKGRKSHLNETLRLIFFAGKVERNELAETLQLSPVIVSRILQKLITQQKIIIVGKGKSTGGRKPEIFSINPDWGKVIGVTFTSRGIISALASPTGVLENVASYDFSYEYSKRQTLDKIYRAISNQIISAHRKSQRIFRISIGISGLVDERLGISLNFPHYEQWQDVPIRSLVEKKFSIKTVVANNVTATTIAENIFGKYRHARNALYFHLGPGLGLGIIIDGKVYRGSRLNIGEFGHTTVGGENNRICYCGSFGCLESFASAEALVSEAESALRNGATSVLGTKKFREPTTTPASQSPGGSKETITASAILKAAAEGDRLAYHLVEKAARYIGIGIANMVNIFAPEIVILGGMMVEESELLVELLKNALRTKALQKIGEDLQVELSSFGRKEGIMGAISLGWADCFETPE